jgi:hypothetical protein
VCFLMHKIEYTYFKSRRYSPRKRIPTHALPLTKTYATHIPLVQAVRHLTRAALRRCFTEWWRLRRERWWKMQLELRDHQARLLSLEVRHMEARPVRFLSRWKARRWVRAWAEFAFTKRAKKAALDKAAARAEGVAKARAVAAWRAAVQRGMAKRAAMVRAVRVDGRRRVRGALAAWAAGARACRTERRLLAAATGWAETMLLRKCLGRWFYMAAFWKVETHAEDLGRRRRVLTFFRSWAAHVRLERALAGLVAWRREVRARRSVGWAFYAWRGIMDGRRTRAINQEVERWAPSGGCVAGAFMLHLLYER